MSWESAGVIAEVVSASAVIVTLMFLALELRANRNSTQSAAVDALSSGFNTVNANLIGDPAFTKTFIDGLANIEQLEEIDRVRLVIFVQSWLNHFTALKKYYDAGVLPEDEWLE